MDGHVIHALGRLLLDDLKHDLRGQILDPLYPGHGLVNGYGAHRNRRVAQNGFADFVDFAAGREIHHRIGAVVYRGVQLLQLLFDVGADRRIADIGIDLAQRGHADGHGLDFGVIDVGRDD